MALTPLLVRCLCAGLLLICGGVTLGISAHVEHSSRIFGVSSSTFTFDAFVGAFTIVAEVLFLAVRILRPSSKVVTFAGEALLGILLWVFWLASGIDTTVYTEQSRSVCKHLDDLFDLPELEGLDAADFETAKKIFKSACSELHAELAFIWIGFVAATFMLGYIVVLAWRHHVRGNRAIWRTPLKTYRSPSVDPFADPEGSYAGPSIGVGLSDPIEDAVSKP